MKRMSLLFHCLFCCFLPILAIAQDLPTSCSPSELPYPEEGTEQSCTEDTYACKLESYSYAKYLSRYKCICGTWAPIEYITWSEICEPGQLELSKRNIYGWKKWTGLFLECNILMTSELNWEMTANKEKVCDRCRYTTSMIDKCIPTRKITKLTQDTHNLPFPHLEGKETTCSQTIDRKYCTDQSTLRDVTASPMKCTGRCFSGSTSNECVPDMG